MLRHSTKMLPHFLFKVQPCFLVDSTQFLEESTKINPSILQY